MITRNLRTILAVVAVSTLLACSHTTKDDNLIPETRHTDWPVLQEAITDYEKGRFDDTRRMSMAALNTFRSLVQTHSDDRIGEVSLYYVGRIHYDIRNYHDARVTFLQFREAFPDSEFIPTVDLLEAEMDQDAKRYDDWIDESRTGSN